MGRSFLNKKFANDRYMRLTPFIILVNLAFLIIYSVCSSPRFATSLSLAHLADWTIFQPRQVLSGRYVWTVFTYPFVTMDILSLLFDSIFLMFFGNRFEMEIGSKEFLFLYFSSSFFAAVVLLVVSAATGANLLAYGPGASIFALIFAFSMLHRYESVMFLFAFRVKLPMFMLILLLLNTLYLYLGIGNAGEILLNFLGFFYALIYVSLRIRIGADQFFKNLF